MKLSVYQHATLRTLPSLGEKYLAGHNSELVEELGLKLDLSHMAMGVASETSELFECLEADDIDIINLIEELGDETWYGSNWANKLGIVLDETRIFIRGHISFHSSPEVDIVIFGGMLSDLAKRALAYKMDFETQEAKRFDDFKKGKAKRFYTNEEILYNFWKAIFSLASQFDLLIEDIMGRNIVKLYGRFKDKFTEDEALNRDIENERILLENKELI